jgi:AcrR family transcriptional regulator
MATDSSADPPRSHRKSAERRAEILAHAITLFAEHGVDTSLRAIGDAIGVSHAALRYYFASRDELLVEVYRTHENSRDDDTEGGRASAVALMESSAETNATIPGLVELYATLTTDALQAGKHPLTHDFIRARFRAVRADLAERIRSGQRTGAIGSDIDADSAAALVAAASDGLQLQWLIDPDAVDIAASLAILERLLPPATATTAR